MTPETLILIATLTTGAVEWQPIPADVCTRLVESLESGAVVQGERADGSIITFASGRCIPDDLPTRIMLTPPSFFGPCEVEGETL
jgi:hypothetical protein